MGQEAITEQFICSRDALGMIEGLEGVTSGFQDCQLVKADVGDLNFPDRNAPPRHFPTTAEIYDQAGRVGLGLFTPETIGSLWQVRELFVDQPSEKRLFIAMEPMSDKAGNKRIFSLTRHGDNYFLGTDMVSIETEWFYNKTFVFLKR